MKIFDLTKTLKSILEQQIWLILTSKTDKLERSLANRIRAYFSRQQKEIIKHFKTTGELIYDDSKWKKELESLFESELQKIIKLGYDRASTEHEELGKKDYNDEIFELWDMYSFSHVGNLIKGINYTTLEGVKKIINDGLIDGESIPAIADRLSEKFNQFKSTRSLTIARTETLGASNWAYMKQMERYGYTEKKYITALDEYVCPICRPLNGKVVSINENFSTTLKTKGEKTTMISSSHPPMHPNCRCTIITVKIKEKKKPSNDEMQIVYESLNKAGKKWNKKNNEYIQDFDNKVREWIEGARFRGDVNEAIEKVKKISQKIVKEAYKKAKIFKAEWPETLLKILDDGRIKNQFETNSSSGLLDFEFRNDVESSLFSIPHTLHPKYKPKYGFWLPEFNRKKYGGLFMNLRQYGNYYIEFKSSIKKRSTLTFGDSLNDNYYIVPFNKDYQPPTAIPFMPYQPISYFKSVIDGKIKDVDDLLTTGGVRYEYTEAQMFGNLTVKDIAKIYIPPLEKNKSITKQIIEKLEELNIPYDFF